MTTMMPFRFLSAVLSALIVLILTAGAWALIAVPAGNRNATQPEIPHDAIVRTQQTGDTFEGKFEKVLRLFRNDPKLVSKIRKTAQRYDIDPVHMIGAIVGEHTYNVDAVDQLQSYYVKALAYAETRIRFEYEGEDVTEFITRPEFSACLGLTDSYSLWTCREDVFNAVFRGQSVDGRTYPDQSFGKTFFQPLFAGQTFGLGQLNPLTALMMTDMARSFGRQRKLDVHKPSDIYQTIMDPDKSLHYMAAVLRSAIDDYQQIAGFDISNNPGLTSTLYNLGGTRGRAVALARENQRREAAGESLKLPEENYYGWLVNDRVDTLRALLN
uniref:DUF1402 family protein n=1 Tax=Pararhizobium sp. IMCC3301 TaxID=3067904 RepID=UPI0035323B05